MESKHVLKRERECERERESKTARRELDNMKAGMSHGNELA